MNEAITKCMKIAIVGEPNVGKSTFINKVIGEKVSIVTPKVQTTRSVIKGILNKGNTQLIFIDTPGLFKAQKTLEKHIVKNAWAGIEEGDIVCVLISAVKGIPPELKAALTKLKAKKNRYLAIINKIDLVRKDSLLPLIDQVNKLGIFDQIFLISALKNDGIDDVVDYLTNKAEISPWIYEEDIYTDTPLRTLTEEITREQLFLMLNKELPYSLKVETEKWEELSDGSLKLYQAIVVLKDSHKNIVVGMNGSKIKSIGERSRMELQRILNRKVHLFLYVKVKADWIEKSIN